MPPGCGPPEIYSTRPLISHLGRACFPMSLVSFMNLEFGFSSKFPF